MLYEVVLADLFSRLGFVSFLSLSLSGAAAGQGHLVLEVWCVDTIVGRTSPHEWSARRRDLCLTTLTRDGHPCHRRVWNRKPCKRSAADPRLTLLGHWDRLCLLIRSENTEIEIRRRAGAWLIALLIGSFVCQWCGMRWSCFNFSFQCE